MDSSSLSSSECRCCRETIDRRVSTSSFGRPAYKQSKDNATKEAAASQLKQILRDQFDSLRAVRRAEIEDLRRRLDQLESDDKINTNRRDEVIDQRFQQLIR
jgi:hypothetical protein